MSGAQLPAFRAAAVCGWRAVVPGPAPALLGLQLGCQAEGLHVDLLGWGAPASWAWRPPESDEDEEDELLEPEPEPEPEPELDELDELEPLPLELLLELSSEEDESEELLLLLLDSTLRFFALWAALSLSLALPGGSCLSSGSSSLASMKAGLTCVRAASQPGPSVRLGGGAPGRSACLGVQQLLRAGGAGRVRGRVLAFVRPARPGRCVPWLPERGGLEQGERAPVALLQAALAGGAGCAVGPGRRPLPAVSGSATCESRGRPGQQAPTLALRPA